MDFTKDELFLMSEGIIRLIKDSGKVTDLVPDKRTKKAIDKYIETLQKLNTKICEVAETV